MNRLKGLCIGKAKVILLGRYVCPHDRKLWIAALRKIQMRRVFVQHLKRKRHPGEMNHISKYETKYLRTVDKTFHA